MRERGSNLPKSKFEDENLSMWGTATLEKRLGRWGWLSCRCQGDINYRGENGKNSSIDIAEGLSKGRSWDEGAGTIFEDRNLGAKTGPSGLHLVGGEFGGEIESFREGLTRGGMLSDCQERSWKAAYAVRRELRSRSAAQKYNLEGFVEVMMEQELGNHLVASARRKWDG